MIGCPVVGVGGLVTHGLRARHVVDIVLLKQKHGFLPHVGPPVYLRCVLLKVMPVRLKSVDSDVPIAAIDTGAGRCGLPIQGSLRRDEVGQSSLTNITLRQT